MNDHDLDSIETLRPGDCFIFKGFKWIVLDNNLDGGVLAIMAKCWKEIPFDNNYSNDYRTSSLRKQLTEELLPILGEENLVPHEVDLTADNGDTTYGTVVDKVFILSCDEYRKYREHVPLLKAWMWTCTPWYISPHAGGSHSVRNVCSAGILGGSNAYDSYGVAPACVFRAKNLKLRKTIEIV